jgi:hypothetical protein
VKACQPLGHFDLTNKQKAPVSFPTEAFAFFVVTRYLPPAGGPAVRNSANSVELLIFVTTQGSGPSVADGCSMMPRPTGIGPKAIE